MAIAAVNECYSWVGLFDCSPPLSACIELGTMEGRLWEGGLQVQPSSNHPSPVL